ncbi:hypothetical protein [Bacillus coahuilensis]|nr:hypothetical protein [Bacillus coahuilensis]
MRKIANLHKKEMTENTMIFTTNEQEIVKGIVPTGQLIVDSDQLSFVYLGEVEEEYVYLYLSETCWEDLRAGIHNNVQFFLDVDGEVVELIELNEELTYLISNIEGNGNYGEQMVEKVESIFINS